MIRINQIKLSVDSGEDRLYRKISELLKTKSYEFIRIVKKSIDARDKNNLLYIYSVDVRCADEENIINKLHNNNIMLINPVKYEFPTVKTNEKARRPVIVGAGPAGYFCALYLARSGFKPIVIEQGKDVEKRAADVLDFWNGGRINPASNVSFGEGGAGTFSDGKLNTGIKDKRGRIDAVISDFIRFGAPAEIAYINKPHVGTDKLREIMKNMRAEIISLGGEVRFDTRFVAFDEKNSTLRGVTVINADSEYDIDTDALVLAIGHSARDTFVYLSNSGLDMEEKAIAVGLRVEHRRETIDKGQYGDSDMAAKLPAADYKMTYRTREGRSVYSFCMCPGGYVVNASSSEGETAVNGMSYHGRDAANSNSAIVVGVTPEDYHNAGFDGVLAGMYFQKKYERLAYEEGGGAIPIQTLGDYEANKRTEKLGNVTPCIKGKYITANLNNCLPSYVNNAIIEAIHAYDGKLSGFADKDAVLSGVESRTSSPVRILRNDAYMGSVGGIFPCGEGCGYAGGITSAAVDGIKVAEAVSQFLNNNIRN